MVDKIEPLELADTWTFKPPDQPKAYDPSIDGKTALVKVAKLEAAWETRRQDHEIYLGVKYLMKQLNVKAYAPCWLEKIEDDIFKFTVKSAKEMLDHLFTQCLKVTNKEGDCMASTHNTCSSQDPGAEFSKHWCTHPNLKVFPFMNGSITPPNTIGQIEFQHWFIK